jgi:uncharacterized Zn-binding protein involved in type VI secretion
MPPALRVGDLSGHGGAIVPPGCPTVLIANLPAARISDLHACPVPPPAGPHPPSPLVPGVATVLIGGVPAAVVGNTSGCGAPMLPPGCPTVLIGG